MATAEELVVAFKSEGATETQQNIEGVEESLEETTDTLEDQSDQMGDFTTKIRGAMNALVAGFAIAAGGLLTQVPVLQEVFGGFSAIVTQLGLAIDEDLRPALGGFSEDLFDLAAQLDSEKGILKNLDILATELADLGSEAITVSVEGDVIGAASGDIVRFVFPALENGDVLDALFTGPDLSRLSVVSVVFGSAIVGSSRLLTYLFPTTITAPQLLAFVLPVVAGAAVLDKIFGGVNMTEALIITALFAGVTLTAALILGATFGAVTIAGSAIIGTLFAGIAITAAMVLEHLFGEGKRRRTSPMAGGGAGGQGRPTTTAPDTLAAIRRGELTGPEQFSGPTDFRSAPMAARNIEYQIDGRSVTENTGRYRRDGTARRGVD